MSVTELVVIFRKNSFSEKNNFGKKHFIVKNTYVLPRHFTSKSGALKVTFSLTDLTFTFFWCAHHGVSR